MLLAAELLNISLMQILGISLVTMAVISVAVFRFSVSGGVSVSMESGRVKAIKGEEYETVLSIESRGSGWIGSVPTTFKVDTGELKKIEPLSEGRMKLRFQAKYAGRTEGVRIGISLTDPLKLLNRLDEVVYTEFVLDTLPLSLLAPVSPRRLTVIGFGEQPTGFPGPGQELYGLEEYNTSMDTKDVIWKRVAKSTDESLIARVREAGVKDAVKVGIVKFAERRDDQTAWTDLLCEALGRVGKEVFEMGASVTLFYSAREGGEDIDSEEERVLGMARMRATDVDELAEAIMSCSVAPASREINAVLANSDFVVTGMRELADDRMSMLIAEKPLLVLSEEVRSVPPLAQRAVIWTGSENLLPLIRRILET